MKKELYFLKEAFDTLADQYRIGIDEALSNGNEKMAEEIREEFAEAETAGENIEGIVRRYVE